MPNLTERRRLYNIKTWEYRKNDAVHQRTDCERRLKVRVGGYISQSKQTGLGIP